MSCNEKQTVALLKQDAQKLPVLQPPLEGWDIIKKKLPKAEKKKNTPLFTGIAASIFIVFASFNIYTFHQEIQLSEYIAQSQKLENKLNKTIKYQHDEHLHWKLQLIDKKLSENPIGISKKLLWKQRVNLLNDSISRKNLKLLYI